jgi:hypothetical protein
MAGSITHVTDPVAFTAWFKDKHAISLRRTTVEDRTDSESVVAATVQSDDTIGEAEQIADYADRWSLVVEGGQWRMSSLRTELANGVSIDTARELRVAVEEYDHLEEKAYAADDAQVVKPRATANIIMQLKKGFDSKRAKGDHEVEKLEGITFRGFRLPSQGRADVDAIETWSSTHYDPRGLPTSREPPTALYMTMHFVREGSTWLLDKTEFYSTNPF